MSNDHATLGEQWRIRNAAAVTLALTEDQMQRAVRAASVAELVTLVESFSPARAYGPEWSRTFEPLVERLWTWRGNDTMAALAEVFRSRGMPWAAVTNALSADHGELCRGALRQPAWARIQAFTLV